MKKRKSECTPEEWAANLALYRQYYWNNVERIRAKQRARAQRPEVKAKRKKRGDTPEAAAKRKAFNASPEGKAYRKARYAAVKADPIKWAKRLDAQRRRRTGLGNGDVDRLLVIQENKCGVCSRPFEKGQQVRADHCHDTGKPRGLLCHHCNIMEGMLRGMALSPEDFAERLRRFLDHPPADLL